ncbi:MAG: hypothetical protein H8E56_00075 [Candidatus Marinimicrobia bacterium]|nr:hypothetical protein [Candidatus Neomarinimicrobiota bacterium]
MNISKQDGFFTQIFPLAFVGDVSAGSLRKYLMNNYKIKGIDAFPERDNEKTRVFEGAKMSVCILYMLNELPNKNFFMRTHWDRFVDELNEKVNIDIDGIESIDKKNYSFPITTGNELKILKKVYSIQLRLLDIGHCYTGEIDLSIGKKYLTENKNDEILIKGAILDRFELRKKMSQGQIQFLDKTHYLTENKGKKSSHHSSRRIVMQAITGVNEKVRLKMTIVDENIFCANSVNYLWISKENISLEYLLGLMNSRLLNFIFSVNSTNSNVNGYEVDNLPIEISKNQNLIGNLADQILTAKKVNPQADTSKLEREIDVLVYDLYGLTEEEIAIVEESVE